MNLLFIRKFVQKDEFEREYHINYGTLFRRIVNEHLTMVAPPMILYHDDEFTPIGLDCEFAIPVLECKESRKFEPGLCLKTTLYGPYEQLSEVYAKHMKVVDKNNYEISDAVFEIYVSYPSSIKDEKELTTEIYTPIRSKL